MFATNSAASAQDCPRPEIIQMALLLTYASIINFLFGRLQYNDFNYRQLISPYSVPPSNPHCSSGYIFLASPSPFSHQSQVWFGRHWKNWSVWCLAADSTNGSLHSDSCTRDGGSCVAHLPLLSPSHRCRSVPLLLRRLRSRLTELPLCQLGRQ